MILHTAIQARKDGTVVARGRSGAVYVFRPSGDGEMACDVGHVEDVADLLATGRFYPALEADFDQALALTKPDGLDDDDDADDGNTRADQLPVEANTPPAPSRGRKARG